MFRQTYLGSQYGESREKSHALDQTFLLSRGDEDLRKKAPMVHDSTHDPLILQLLKEVNKLKAERQAEIPDWNQPRPGPLTRRILDTPSKQDSFKELRKLFVSQHIFQTNRLHFANDLYIIHQKPNESLCMYTGRFSHEYSRCAEVDDKTALKAFTAGLRDCFFKYMINANTWKTYS
ncbi:hypothetical protein ACFX2F_003410 [Malus domestica]